MHWLFGPARIRFCEQAVAGPIKHPADVWTNLGPLLAAVCILRRARHPLERLLGVAALWTALASAYFHASDTILGETVDLGGMFLFILTVAALQQHRVSLPREDTSVQQGHSGLRHVCLRSDKRLIVLVLAVTTALMILSAYTTMLASPAFGCIVVLVALREIRSKNRIGRYGWSLVATFLIAWGIWWLDYLRILCYPSNHILTGHGVWHLLSGLVFWFAFLHFRVDSDSDACDRHPRHE